MWNELYPFFTKHWSELTLMIGGVGTYFLGKKHKDKVGKNEEVKGELHNIDTALSIYRKMVEDLGKDLAKLNESYDKLYVNFKIATDKIEWQKVKIDSLEKENKELIDLMGNCDYDCKTHPKKK